MKLEVTYSKKASGKIEAVLAIVEAGDYPTRSIFSTSDSIASEDFVLAPSNSTSVVCEFENAMEAENAVENYVSLIQSALNHWRSFHVPTPKTFQI